MTIATKVPMMFRAQVEGRCQLQRIDPDRRAKKDKPRQKQDAELWVDEWHKYADLKPPQFSTAVRTKTFKISWRFVTNGGQDDGIIRPVIGARGIPFYPGSSMKGIFRRACTAEQANRYCGQDLGRDGMQPGILRFLGGYPTDTRWRDHLVDIVHPQQDWQVKQNQKSMGAFVQISLYQPEIQVGLSSTEDLSDEEWQTIWSIWERALATGIGCRVCAGYGQPHPTRSSQTLYSVRLKGQGQAAKLIDDTGEFRPNIFRAAIRGHALRIFGGLTDAKTAQQLVNQLFGSIQEGGNTGLLNMAFRAANLTLGSYGQGSYAQPTYEVEGDLIWSMTRALPDAETAALRNLVGYLMRFAMVLGGFGKSWRRADHRLFYPEYAEQDYKPLIGCHWQWTGDQSLRKDVRVYKLEQLGQFINGVRQFAQEWMILQGVQPSPQKMAPWREAWHPENVEVWGRLAEQQEDSRAIYWLHRPYREAMPRAKITEGSIYRSTLTGQMGQVGRLWHRMYPVIGFFRKKGDTSSQPFPRTTQKFFELLTIFPDGSKDTEKFLNFLDSQQQLDKGFKLLWPLE